jgi:hypothetical protein
MAASSRVIALMLFLLVLAWACWLWHARKTPFDYVIDTARHSPPIPLCRWVRVDDPDIAGLGLSRTPPPAWTDSKTAYLAFKTGQRLPWYVDVAIVAVEGTGVSVSADGGTPRAIPRVPLPRGRIVRLPLSLNVAAGVHEITIRVAGPKPPSGREQRWLGVAVSNIRVCDSLDPTRPT